MNKAAAFFAAFWLTEVIAFKFLANEPVPFWLYILHSMAISVFLALVFKW